MSQNENEIKEKEARMFLIAALGTCVHAYGIKATTKVLEDLDLGFLLKTEMNNESN